MSFHRAAQWAIPFLLLSSELAMSKTLVPIRPSSGRNAKRQEPAGMDLKSQETFSWGEREDGNAMADLTVYMEGDDENVLSMENFDGMLKEVECGEGTMSMTFKDDESFAYAQNAWDWVNGADNRSFVMAVGAGDCGDNDRMPVVVSSIEYDEEQNKATLAAMESEWKEVAHTYDFNVGKVEEEVQAPANGTNSSMLRPRDIEDETSIDFNHDLPFSIALGVPPFEGRLLCTNCSTSGSFDFQFTISQKLFVPTGASFKLSPKAVSAIAQIKLALSGDLNDGLVKSFDILSIPISALNIPGVLEFGPFLKVAVGAEILPVTVTAGIQTGATASLSDDAVLKMDLLNPEENEFSGWEPEVDLIDVTVDASVSTGVQVFMRPSVEIRAEALSKGFEFGINLKVPTLNAKLFGIASPTGACPPVEGEKAKTLGVKTNINLGAELTLETKKADDESDPLFTVNLATLAKPLAEKCFPVGPEVEARSIGHPHARPEIAAF